jgi:hypothetical protein
MNKPEVKDAHPMHIHVCSGCNESMRHFSRDGCTMPEVIMCETCKHPPKDEESGRGSVADVEPIFETEEQASGSESNL